MKLLENTWIWKLKINILTKAFHPLSTQIRVNSRIFHKELFLEKKKSTIHLILTIIQIQLMTLRAAMKIQETKQPEDSLLKCRKSSVEQLQKAEQNL